MLKTDSLLICDVFLIIRADKKKKLFLSPITIFAVCSGQIAMLTTALRLRYEITLRSRLSKLNQKATLKNQRQNRVRTPL